jgi:serine protease Do
MLMKKSKSEKRKRSGLKSVLPLLLLSPLLISTLPLVSVAQSPTEIQGIRFSPEKLSASFADVATRVESAVVSIDAKTFSIAQMRGEFGLSPDEINGLPNRQARPSYSVGSGFLVDSKGHIITNFHVVDEAASISVRLLNGKEYKARLVGSDQETDLAVLKIDASEPLPFLRFGNSDIARVGDWVLALGSPFGLDRTVTAGIISQVKRETPYATAFQKFIQTDAAINKGNSGGPLVNMNGEVVGVNSQIATSTGDYNGVGFALPSNEVVAVLEQILDSGRVKRGFLGVNLETVKEEYAKVFGLSESRGAIISDIREKNSPAAIAGLKVGDIVVAINDIKVDNALDMISRVGVFRPLEKVRVTFYRETNDKLERSVVEVTLGERPSSNGNAGSPGELTTSSESSQMDRERPFGLALGELIGSQAEKQRFGDETGVIVREISPTSFFADVRGKTSLETLRRGDLIQRINRVSVTDTDSFLNVALNIRTGDPLVLHVLSFDPSTRAVQRKIVQYTVR